MGDVDGTIEKSLQECEVASTDYWTEYGNLAQANKDTSELCTTDTSKGASSTLDTKKSDVVDKCVTKIKTVSDNLGLTDDSETPLVQLDTFYKPVQAKCKEALSNCKRLTSFMCSCPTGTNPSSAQPQTSPSSSTISQTTPVSTPLSSSSSSPSNSSLTSSNSSLTSSSSSSNSTASTTPTTKTSSTTTPTTTTSSTTTSTSTTTSVTTTTSSTTTTTTTSTTTSTT